MHDGFLGSVNPLSHLLGAAPLVRHESGVLKTVSVGALNLDGMDVKALRDKLDEAWDNGSLTAEFLDAWRDLERASIEEGELRVKTCLNQTRTAHLHQGDSRMYWFRAPQDGAYRFVHSEDFNLHGRVHVHPPEPHRKPRQLSGARHPFRGSRER